jgi:hypothetical protein
MDIAVPLMATAVKGANLCTDLAQAAPTAALALHLALQPPPRCLLPANVVALVVSPARAAHSAIAVVSMDIVVVIQTTVELDVNLLSVLAPAQQHKRRRSRQALQRQAPQARRARTELVVAQRDTPVPAVDTVTAVADTDTGKNVG